MTEKSEVKTMHTSFPVMDILNKIDSLYCFKQSRSEN